MDEDFIVVTTYDIDGAEIEKHIGLVQGSTVRARNVGSDFLANLKNIVGGELVGYSKLLQTSREQAYARMIEDAKSKGATCRSPWHHMRALRQAFDDVKKGPAWASST